MNPINTNKGREASAKNREKKTCALIRVPRITAILKNASSVRPRLSGTTYVNAKDATENLRNDPPCAPVCRVPQNEASFSASGKQKLRPRTGAADCLRMINASSACPRVQVPHLGTQGNCQKRNDRPLLAPPFFRYHIVRESKNDTKINTQLREDNMFGTREGSWK